MAKVLFTSDQHIINGIRKEVFINYILYLISFCQENNIKTVVFGGDLFDRPFFSKLKNDTFIDSFFVLRKLSKVAKLYFIIGNHTIHRLDNKDNIVRVLSTFGTVIEEFTQIDVDGKTIDLLSYTDNWNEIPEKGYILFSHFPIRGMMFSGQKDDDDKGVPIEKFSGYERVFLGDIHKHQEKKNVVYSGSPYMTNYGERTLKQTGFLIVETNDASYEFFPYEDAPKYIQISIDDALDVDVANCFVKVEIKEKTENFIKLKHVLYERGALEVIPEFKSNDEKAIIESTVDFDFKNKIDNMLYEYVDSIKEQEGISKEKIKEIISGVIH